MLMTSLDNGFSSQAWLSAAMFTLWSALAALFFFLGSGLSAETGREGLSHDVSYDVYVKLGVDHMGRPEFSDVIAHFREQRNAVAYKGQLETRGEIVHVYKSAIYSFSEAEKEEWFMDYEPKASPADQPAASESPTELAPGARAPMIDDTEPSDRRREPWYRRWFVG